MDLDFLMIGAEKAGTTFIQTNLSRHPEIFMPPIEITYFLTPDYLALNEDFLHRTFFYQVKGEMKKGIRNPLYLTLSEIPSRIQNHSPKAKLIIILRNPIKRAISAYFHYMRFSLLPLLPLNEGVQKILEGKYQNTRYQQIAEGIIDFGFYYKHIQRYLQYFDREQMLILLNSEIRNNKEKVFRDICSFLGINKDFTPDSSIGLRIINYLMSNKGIYSLKRLKLYRSYVSCIYNHKFEQNSWPYRNRIYFKNKALLRPIYYLYNLLDQLIFTNIFKQTKPQLTPLLRKRLYHLYNDDMNHLEKFLSKPLNSWRL